MSDMPIEELEEMVEWFRETAGDYEDKMSRYEKDKYRAAYRGKASGFTSAANRLNAKIDHHKDD